MDEDDDVDLRDIEASIEHCLRRIDDALPLPSEIPQSPTAKPRRRRKRPRVGTVEHGDTLEPSSEEQRIPDVTPPLKLKGNSLEEHPISSLALIPKVEKASASRHLEKPFNVDLDAPNVVSIQPDKYVPQHYQSGLESSSMRRIVKETVENGQGLNVKSFVERHRYEIGAFGASRLDRKSKRTYDQERSRKLGIQIAKQRKIPASILRGMRKKERERRKKKEEFARASGMLLRSKRSVGRKGRR